jgi:hypothetical protein
MAIDSFTSAISAAGWHLESTSDADVVEVKTLDDIESKSKQLREALARLKIEPRPAKSRSRINSSISSIASLASSRGLYTLSEEAFSTPLLSPLFSSQDSFVSTPPSSVDGDENSTSSQRSSLYKTKSSEEASQLPVVTLPVRRDSQASTVHNRHAPPVVDFYLNNVASDKPSQNQAVEDLVNYFPRLCESPGDMYGQPIAPTKKNRVSPEERRARKSAIRYEYRGSVSHSLLKVSVVLETRHIIWRRAGVLTHAQQRPALEVLTKEALEPWSIELDHGEIDISESAKKRLQKVFQLKDSERVGQCDGCSGSGIFQNACNRCQGQGRCLFSAQLQVSMASVDLNAVPLSSFMNLQDERSTQDICIEKARRMVDDILDPSENHPSRPFRIIARVDTSSSHLVKLEIPQAGKIVTKKNSAPLLRSNSFFHRKMTFLPVYFIMPSDPSLSPIQLSIEDFQAALMEHKTNFFPTSQIKHHEIAGETMKVESDQPSRVSPDGLLELSFSSLSSTSLDLPLLLFNPELSA